MRHPYTIVIGLACGDCGKGCLVDYLTRTTSARTVVRFNGGPQAGHNIITPDGRHHTFSQFGSGTFAGAQTLLSRFMMIEPYAMLNEAAHLQALGCDDIWSRLYIDEQCIVITPVHQAANRLRELVRCEAAHGTCGQGVGEATADAIEFPSQTIRAGDMVDRHLIESKLRDIAARKAKQLESTIRFLRDQPGAATDIRTIEEPDWISIAAGGCADVADAADIVRRTKACELLRQGGIIFEGAQGVLLDQDIGFHPHTTWSRTTQINALQLLAEAGLTTKPRTIGVLRCYATRHGAGPFVTQDSNLRSKLTEPHNIDTGRQGRFRIGTFDCVAARYTLAHADVDEIALTHLDRLPLLPPRICTAYTHYGQRIEIQSLPPDDLAARSAQSRKLLECEPVFTDLDDMTAAPFVERIESELGIPVHLTAAGPTADHIGTCALRQSTYS